MLRWINKISLLKWNKYLGKLKGIKLQLRDEMWCEVRVLWNEIMA